MSEIDSTWDPKWSNSIPRHSGTLPKHSWPDCGGCISRAKSTICVADPRICKRSKSTAKHRAKEIITIRIFQDAQRLDVLTQATYWPSKWHTHVLNMTDTTRNMHPELARRNTWRGNANWKCLAQPSLMGIALQNAHVKVAKHEIACTD